MAKGGSVCTPENSQPAQGEAEMLLRLLRIRFGTLPTDAVARVQEADPEILLHWSERVLTAATLDEVFAA
jgi:hypothetical protein